MRLIRSPGRATVLRLLAVTSLALTAFTAWLSVPANAATNFADPAFQQQWTTGEAITPNFWGPLTLAQDGRPEPYVEGQYNGQSGVRLVQYFDKARMEKKNDGTVSNGLLATELITGRLQRGDNTFDQGTPAGIPVAGDPDNLGPTYASINANKSNLLDNAANITNAPATKALKGDGTFGSFTNATADPNTIIATFDTTTSHNVPKAFVDYRNKAGLLTIGLAISESFWSNVKVGGTLKDVLIQPFERRVLTYTPTNPDPFKVEFGNIGQHYYTWRYLSPGVFSTPTPAGAAATSTAAALTTSTAAAQATGTAAATGTATTTATATGTVTATTTTTASATTTADTQPPKFKAAPVVAYATPNSFAITWATDEPASSELVFGEDATNYNQQNLNLQKVFSVDHQVVIRNLSAGKTYHWKAQSRDPSGNLVTDDTDRTVTLPADKNDGTMGAVPRITNLSIAKQTTTTFTVTWTTDVASRSRIEYGRLDLPTSPSGEGYDRWRTGDNGDPISTNHSVTAVSLMPVSPYRFRIVSIFGDNGTTSSAGDDRALMSTLNKAVTNDVSTAIKINDFTAPKQDRKGSPVVFSFGTDRNASVIIEIGDTNQFGSLFYGSSDDPQGLRDYPYNAGFNRSRHTISLNLQPGTYYYRITVFDEQGTGTLTGDKTITVT